MSGSPHSPRSPRSPHLEERDPIMEDDHFSLRYGNPIQVIHDIKKHEIDTFEPSKNHVSGSLTNSVGDLLTSEKQKKRIPLNKRGSSFERDSTICSDFYHTKNGSVCETEHHDSNIFQNNKE